MRRRLPALLFTGLTCLAAALWFFPIYWALVTSLKPEFDVVQPGVALLPQHPTLDAYSYVFTHTAILHWYLNSTGTSVTVTLLVLCLSSACAYALSQLRFHGQYLLYGVILASFMVPVQALIVTHFVLMNSFGLIDTWLGVILPQLVVPVTVIVYKQFFDQIPKEFREAALLDGATEFQIFSRIYLPMNWGVTTALAIITFIGAWNNFLWPFLVSNSNASMTVTVGITQVHENFGVQYARNLAGAVIAALPVAIAYLLFQRRVTEAIMLSAGIKG
ncbi:carbohydrate ABC transporter permease [Lichenihabitans sp. Uapishka_5]|uniref:carbohydrate ABC transporter permease n=1 Tax=Lichenihabitans sp. Uapishka_5 TaxID=3037302 RepID=UPI0029E80BE2|nr:carbohydrate ABC transporter permease [Lichenihabitans sp. Uapishka_5]MDX7951172.1 carbohydrate ABC transporter permease [Lichenihabitans sp. Uapishka_5]